VARRDRDVAERLFAALSWPASYALTFEVGDWARQAVEAGCAGPTAHGTAATMAAIIGNFDEGERLARAGIAAAADPLAPDTWMCWTAVMQGVSRAGWNDAVDEATRAAHHAATACIGDWGDAFFSAVVASRAARRDPPTAAANARRAESIIAATRNPVLTVDVLHLLGVFHCRQGEFDRGVELARRALALAEAWQLPRSGDGARNSVAQVELMNPSGDPLPAVREAVIGAVRERLWFDLWPTVRTLARWLADHDRQALATVIIGHLDANGLSPVGRRPFEELRDAPGAQALLERGASFDRDELAAYILEQLPDPG
jgi:hypothetical protein